MSIKIYKQKYGVTSSVAMATSKQCIVVPWKIENTYATITLQVLPNLLTLPSPSTLKTMPHSAFGTLPICI
jgi:hypothetical protein